MDPNNSATDEKSSMGQSPPPPYEDSPNPQPGPGYQPQAKSSGASPQYGGAGFGQQPYPMGQPFPMGQPYTMGQPYPMGQPFPMGQPYTMGQPFPMGQPYSEMIFTVYVYPQVNGTQGPLANPVNDYLAYSIFNMIFCCLPLVVAALIYSISVGAITDGLFKHPGIIQPASGLPMIHVFGDF